MRGQDIKEEVVEKDEDGRKLICEIEKGNRDVETKKVKYGKH